MVTHVIHSIFSEPVEALKKEQQREEGHEFRAEVIPEDREGQTSFGDGVPRSLDEVLRSGDRSGLRFLLLYLQVVLPGKTTRERRTCLHFCGAELSKEHFPHELPHKDHHNEGLEVNDLREQGRLV